MKTGNHEVTHLVNSFRASIYTWAGSTKGLVVFSCPYFNLFSNLSPFWNFISRTSNIAFLMDWAQMSDLDFGLIRQNISIKKASFHHQGCPLSLKSAKLWLNSYVYWISITSNWFYSHQFSLPYSKNILSVWFFRGDNKKKKKVLANPTDFFH